MPKISTHRIGFLATGNELVEGDILNTNGQMIARDLVDCGLTIGMHVVTSDLDAHIEQGLRFLLEHHDTVIIIGGLGPTSDDRTRYALSNVIGEELVFNEETWGQLLIRFKSLSLNPHPDNRQQAFFPQGAEIFPNKNGSAAGCGVKYKNKTIYMLPGPPTECLPMFQEFILPVLAENSEKKLIKLKWRLLGVVESDIAAEVDVAIKPFAVATGYRIEHPYLEVKVYAEQKSAIENIKTAIQKIVGPYLIDETNKKASELLCEILEKMAGTVVINDQATHGRLESLLVTPATYKHLSFVQMGEIKPNELRIDISGLNAFWEGMSPTGYEKIILKFTDVQGTEQQQVEVPFRHSAVVAYAVEYIALAVLRFLWKRNDLFGGEGGIRTHVGR